MMANQCIKCTVANCVHNNEAMSDCKLHSIMVVPSSNNPEAHFCKSYQPKQEHSAMF